MKKFGLILCLQVLFTVTCFAQAQYEVSIDKSRNNQKVLTGIINKYLVMNDSAFLWYGSNQKGYNVPDRGILTAMEKNKDRVNYIIFGGTWCEDTQNILPKFFKLQEQAGVPDSKITFFGVDPDKKSLGHIAEAMNITNVPTIIIMKDGKELGRIVEYGKTGHWDKDILTILPE